MSNGNEREMNEHRRTKQTWENRAVSRHDKDKEKGEREASEDKCLTTLETKLKTSLSQYFYKLLAADLRTFTRGLLMYVCLYIYIYISSVGE